MMFRPPGGVRPQGPTVRPAAKAGIRPWSMQPAVVTPQAPGLVAAGSVAAAGMRPMQPRGPPPMMGQAATLKRKVDQVSGTMPTGPRPKAQVVVKPGAPQAAQAARPMVMQSVAKGGAKVTPPQGSAGRVVAAAGVAPVVVPKVYTMSGASSARGGGPTAPAYPPTTRPPGLVTAGAATVRVQPVAAARVPQQTVQVAQAQAAQRQQQVQLAAQHAAAKQQHAQQQQATQQQHAQNQQAVARAKAAAGPKPLPVRGFGAPKVASVVAPAAKPGAPVPGRPVSAGLVPTALRPQPAKAKPPAGAPPSQFGQRPVYALAKPAGIAAPTASAAGTAAAVAAAAGADLKNDAVKQAVKMRKIEALAKQLLSEWVTLSKERQAEALSMIAARFAETVPVEFLATMVEQLAGGAYGDAEKSDADAFEDGNFTEEVPADGEEWSAS